MAQPTAPSVDPSRQFTIGMILLMVVFFAYCHVIMPTQRAGENHTNSPSATGENAPPDTIGANDPDGTNAGGANHTANANAPANNEPAPNANAANNAPPANANADNANTSPPDNGTTGPPAGDGEMVDPETGERFPAGFRFNPRTGNELVPADPQSQPTGTGGNRLPDTVRWDDAAKAAFESTLHGGEAYNTPLIEPQFSTRGAAVAWLTIRDFPGMSGRDHRFDLEDYNQALRPFVPTAMSFTVGARGLPRTPADPGYLANVHWHFAGHTANKLNETDENGAPVVQHTVTFTFPPPAADGDDADGEGNDESAMGPLGAADSPFLLTRTYTYRSDSYAIHAGLTIENHSDQPINLDGLTFRGPMGLHPGYFFPNESDLIYAEVDHMAGASVVPVSSSGNPGQGELIHGDPDKALIQRQLTQMFPEGFERTDPQIERLGEIRVTASPENKSQNILWMGMLIDYVNASIFSPEAPEGQTAPRVSVARADSFPMQWPHADEEANPRLWLVGILLQTEGMTIPPGESRTLTTKAFVGPAYPDALEAAGLGKTIQYSYSWVEGIAYPLLAAMNFFHSIIPNWGIAIILLTLLVRGILLPVSYWSQLKMQESMAGMKRIQPRLEKLKKKYKDDRQKLHMEQIKLMREEGVSMGGAFQGCILMLLQMPIWIALFGAFRYAIDFVGADFLWIQDLSKPDALVSFGPGWFPSLPLIGTMLQHSITPAGVWQLNILPVVVMVLMYYQMTMTQKMQSHSMSDDQMRQQRVMMGCMFVFFFFFFYSMPAGFNLYFLATTLYAIVETRYLKQHINRRVEQRWGPQGGKPAPAKG